MFIINGKEITDVSVGTTEITDIYNGTTETYTDVCTVTCSATYGTISTNKLKVHRLTPFTPNATDPIMYFTDHITGEEITLTATPYADTEKFTYTWNQWQYTSPSSGYRRVDEDMTMTAVFNRTYNYYDLNLSKVNCTLTSSGQTVSSLKVAPNSTASASGAVLTITEPNGNIITVTATKYPDDEGHTYADPVWSINGTINTDNMTFYCRSEVSYTNYTITINVQTTSGTDTITYTVGWGSKVWLSIEDSDKISDNNKLHVCVQDSNGSGTTYHYWTYTNIAAGFDVSRHSRYSISNDSSLYVDWMERKGTSGEYTITGAETINVVQSYKERYYLLDLIDSNESNWDWLFVEDAEDYNILRPWNAEYITVSSWATISWNNGTITISDWTNFVNGTPSGSATTTYHPMAANPVMLPDTFTVRVVGYDTSSYSSTTIVNYSYTWNKGSNYIIRNIFDNVGPIGAEHKTATTLSGQSYVSPYWEVVKVVDYTRAASSRNTWTSFTLTTEVTLTDTSNIFCTFGFGTDGYYPMCISLSTSDSNTKYIYSQSDEGRMRISNVTYSNGVLSLDVGIYPTSLLSVNRKFYWRSIYQPKQS